MKNMKHTFKKQLLLLLLFLSASFAHGQLVNLGFPLNPGESKYYCNIAACNSGNDLWAVFQIYDTTYRQYRTKVCKNNGLFWTEYINFPSNVGNGTKGNAIFYNGDLYFNNYYANLNLNSVSYPSMNALLKWDGSSLTFVDSIKGDITDMDTFRNKLIISGNFSKVGTNSISKLAEYNGSTWSALGSPADWVNFQPGFGSVQKQGQLVNQGGMLYITGNWSFVDANKPRYYGLAKYDGSAISPVVNTEFTHVNFSFGQIYAHPDSTRYYANDSFYRTYYCESGKSPIKVNTKSSGYTGGPNQPEKFAYKGNSVYTLKLGFRINSSINNVFIEKFTGSKLKKIAISRNYMVQKDRALGIFGKGVVFLMLQDIVVGDLNFYRLDSNENLSATVSGKAYLDNDKNNYFSSGDMPIANESVVVNPGNITVLTDYNGNYSLPGLDSGRYTFKINKPKNTLFSKPSLGIYTDSLTRDSSVFRDFTFSIDSSVRDIQVGLTAFWGWRARRGFTETYFLKVKNNSAFKKSGTVVLNYGAGFYDPVSYDSSLVFSNGKAVFTFTDLMVNKELVVAFSMKTYNTLSLGGTHKIWCSIDSTLMAWDIDSTNDKDTCYLKLVNGCDPNDKTSLPAGDILPGTRHIQYHINFQNVGNDTAYNVVVVDTLDLRLPLEKIVIGSSSHKFQLRNVNNILIFEFKNIKLVDSATNEKGSKGFIRFSALLSPNLPIGSKVDNRAHIYFDYNDAVITNVASVRIQDKSEIVDQDITQFNKLLVYPNPSSNLIQIVNTLENSSYTIYNLNGETIQTGNAEMGENTINVSGLAKGIYFIVLSNGLNAKISIQ